MISKDEWKGPADVFDQIDTDHDGSLSHDELRAFFQTHRPGRGPRP